MSVLLARAGILAKQTVGGGGGGFDPATSFDLGYGLPSDLTGSNGSNITSWGHTLTLSDGGTGLALPVVATVNSTKVARFTKATPCHLGTSLPSAQAVPFEVRMVCKFTAPDAVHKSAFFSPHPGSTVQADWTPGTAPQDVEMYAGASLTTASPTSLPSSAFHVWLFSYNSTSSLIEADGSSVASGDAGNTSTLTGFHLGSGYFGDVSADYDVVAWGINSGVLSSGDASAALVYLTALIP